MLVNISNTNVFFFCFDLNLEIYINHSIFCQPHKDT